MRVFRRRSVIALMVLVSALVLSSGGLVLAEDTPHEISQRETVCCWDLELPELPCYLCNHIQR